MKNLYYHLLNSSTLIWFVLIIGGCASYCVYPIKSFDGPEAPNGYWYFLTGVMEGELVGPGWRKCCSSGFTHLDLLVVYRARSLDTLDLSLFSIKVSSMRVWYDDDTTITPIAVEVSDTHYNGRRDLSVQIQPIPISCSAKKLYTSFKLRLLKEENEENGENGELLYDENVKILFRKDRKWHSIFWPGR